MTDPDVYMTPGARLRELLRKRRMTQTELAQQTGYSLKHINELCNDNAAITPSAAIKLERALRVSATALNTWSTKHTDRMLREIERQKALADERREERRAQTVASGPSPRVRRSKTKG